MKKLTYLLLVLGCLSLVACRRAQPEPLDSGPVSATLGFPFTLRGGEDALIQSEDLRVKFEAVVEDSRCPADVECVWAGRGVLALVVEHSDGPPERLEISTLPPEDTVSFLDYMIQLEVLDPYPQSASQGINFEQYIATLVIKTK